MSTAETFLKLHDGDPVKAATAVARSLMRDDPEVFKRGYTLDNALLAVRDVFALDAQDTERVRAALVA